MILDTTLKTIEIVLAGAKTTNDCEYTVDYADTNSGTSFVPAGSMGLTNGTSAVTAVPAPTGVQRHVKALTVYNADTVNSTVTVRMFDGTNRRILMKIALSVGETLVYTAERGWDIPGRTLLDYRTGSWTPADASGAGLSFASVDAQYTKLGRMVFAQFFLQYPSTANTSDCLISGLPFTAINQDSASNGILSYPGFSSGGTLRTIKNTTTGIVNIGTATAKNNQLSTQFVIGTFVYPTTA